MWEEVEGEEKNWQSDVADKLSRGGGGGLGAGGEADWGLARQRSRLQDFMSEAFGDGATLKEISALLGAGFEVLPN